MASWSGSVSGKKERIDCYFLTQGGTVPSGVGKSVLGA